ncbi:hypothetical protein HanRHA438_Chr05g0245291 [Helianthus annuus]|nr:hypothetical protein HanRHA438_Chr05g0245291 [Helianthus annuus]
MFVKFDRRSRFLQCIIQSFSILIWIATYGVRYEEEPFFTSLPNSLIFDTTSFASLEISSTKTKHSNTFA